MNSQQPRLVDRCTAEQLLGGAPTGRPDTHPSLATLLAAAAVPGRPGELTGEDASVLAFRTAGTHPGEQPGRLSTFKTVVMKILTVKVFAVAAATTAGGVALAATTGTIPNPLTRPAPAVSSTSSAAHPTATQTRTGHGGADASAGASESGGPGASKAPSAALIGLCRAYGAGNKKEHGKALANPAFSALITAAGGEEKVDEFCQALLAAAASRGSSAGADQNPGKDKKADHPANPKASPRH